MMLGKTELTGMLLSLALAPALFGQQVAGEQVTGQQGISQADFEKLHDELTPEAAAWEAVPWRLSMLEACAVAVREKKPVYMLVRSGHPLGCV